MTALKDRNPKIINAVIAKAKNVCPGSLAMIGVYGSFATGDFHERSDLDLLILINDDGGRQLGSAFIQEDMETGHDIYCTTWEELEENALYNEPHISKLMDSRIVYCADGKYAERLKLLREKAIGILSSPMSEKDYFKAESLMKEAEHFYMSAVISEDIDDIRAQAGYAVYYLENAVAMLNKRYFRLGTKRVYEELALMENKPDRLCEMIESVMSADSAQRVKDGLTMLVRETMLVFKRVRPALLSPKSPVTANSVGGTYEEMFSNWRNKMYIAAEENNRHLAFMSMASLHAMISELAEQADIDGYNVFENYDPHDLKKTASAFDVLINGFLNEYRKAGIRVTSYRDIDDFVEKYPNQ